MTQRAQTRAKAHFPDYQLAFEYESLWIFRIPEYLRAYRGIC